MDANSWFTINTNGKKGRRNYIKVKVIALYSAEDAGRGEQNLIVQHSALLERAKVRA